MNSDQAQVSSDPNISPCLSLGLRYSTSYNVEAETNKQNTMFSNPIHPIQEYPHPITSRPSSPGLRYSTGFDVEPEASKLPQELESFCAIPIHILSTVQKYFLTTVPSPGKIISINLVSESPPVPSSLSDLSSLLEEIAIPDHVLMPLQEYFLNRRTNPEQFPEYVGVRITQEDARLYENVLGCCERGCLVELAEKGASEEGFQGASASLPKGADEIVEHGPGNERSGDVSVIPNVVSNTHPHGSSPDDVEEEESSAEDASETRIHILATAESG